jgi:hypothetical protein
MEALLTPEGMAYANTFINAVSLYLLRGALQALREIKAQAEEVRQQLIRDQKLGQ